MEEEEEEGTFPPFGHLQLLCIEPYTLISGLFKAQFQNGKQQSNDIHGTYKTTNPMLWLVCFTRRR